MQRYCARKLMLLQNLLWGILIYPFACSGLPFLFGCVRCYYLPNSPTSSGSLEDCSPKTQLVSLLLEHLSGHGDPSTCWRSYSLPKGHCLNTFGPSEEIWKSQQKKSQFDPGWTSDITCNAVEPWWHTAWGGKCQSCGSFVLVTTRAWGSLEQVDTTFIQEVCRNKGVLILKRNRFGITICWALPRLPVFFGG